MDNNTEVLDEFIGAAALVHLNVGVTWNKGESVNCDSAGSCFFGKIGGSYKKV